MTSYRKRKDVDSTQIKRHNAEVESVVETLSNMTDPFDEDLEDLVNIANGEIATASMSNDLLKSHEIGEEKFEEFLSEKVKSDVPDIFTPIKKTNLNTFSKKITSSKTTTEKGRVVELRNDSKFISRLLAIGQSREIDMRNLMKYSLRKYPAPLATSSGHLAKTSKCKLMHELLHRAEYDDCSECPPGNTDALLLDGMALFQTLKHIPPTFGELAEQIVHIIITSVKKAQGNRVDFISDTYPLVSIKNLEREKRSMSGVTRVRIGSATQKVPRQFKKFLSLGVNKEALIEFIYQHMTTFDLAPLLQHVTLFFTHGAECHKFFVDTLSDNMLKIESVPELHSNHEEPDTRLLLHAQHASTMHSSVRIRSPDTDVFILMLAHNAEIRSLLYFDTGSGNNRRVIDINEVHAQLGSRLCNALIGFHAFTGLYILLMF